MFFYLDDDQIVLQDIICDFVVEYVFVSYMWVLCDVGDKIGFLCDLWKQFVEMGFIGIFIGEIDGGFGFGYVEVGVVLEEIGCNLLFFFFLIIVIVVVEVLKGSFYVVCWFFGIIVGEIVVVFVIDEVVKYCGIIVMMVECLGNGFKLIGVKCFVVYGYIVDLIIVVVCIVGSVDDVDGIMLFVVLKGVVGFFVQVECFVDVSLVVCFDFDGVEVDVDVVIGEVDVGCMLFECLFCVGCIGVFVELFGVGGGVMDMMIGYLKECKQFGMLIGSFQVFQYCVVYFYLEMEVVCVVVFKVQ